MSNQLDLVEATCTRLVRRMVNLPRALSRAVDQGLDLMRTGGSRRNHLQYPPPNGPMHHPIDRSFTNTLEPDWVFLACFEQRFGLVHPFFYACRFVKALKMARDEGKFVFLYLHSPDHPFTPPFCKDTLCCEVVVQFLDANFVCWGGVADDRGEGSHVAKTLRPASFPFCAVVAPGSDDSLDVLQQMEGPVSPTELLEVLQKTLKQQGLVFGNVRTKEEEKRQVDLLLREEQDAAYFASLQVDKKKMSKEGKKPKFQDDVIANAQDTKILIRFPNGERKEKEFSCIDKVQAIFVFIDSQGLLGISGNYRLVSSYPKKVYGVNQMEMTLKDAGFYPRATLFIEPV